MRNVNFILLIFILTVLSCSKEEIPNLKKCIEKSENPNWITEDFKHNYTIQFPSNYLGNGMMEFEGVFFNKRRDDGEIEFNYNFCLLIYCDQYGDTLNESIPDSIIAKDKIGATISLTSKKNFCLNENSVGILYYNSEQNSTGKYFMRHDSYFLDALTVYFEKDEYQEVENIIKTIYEK